ncbi:hypothetical protein [Kribbella italica]|uniref:Uncharacterized protein n=1 Tax=Kribbella italica TaxID=1540520 RepID=A0A7W9J2D2_9ACTN|nr:hypothetical protein [Kribbella italica]MBB5834382.1 hypothetical protein [Kribbella italica]
MRADTGQRTGVEWVGRPDEDSPELERDAHGWPILHQACDSVNPANRHRCVVGRHVGEHRDDTGAEWLDNGL